jgi:hypothetical protein
MFLTALLLVLAADPSPPTIQILEAKSVEVSGLSERFAQRTAEEWAESLQLFVVGNEKGPALLGTHSYRSGTLRFEPRFPFVPGVAYRVVFREGKSEITKEFTIPKPKVEPGLVAAIFPSAEKLPENTLRFYVQFSKPMRRGEIYQHITLTNDTDHKLVDLPFLELDEELWSADRKRLTLLVDPGRIKREVKPREDLGPALESGKKFTLKISKNWHDADNEPLTETFAKSFTVTAPQREAIDPERWTILPPAAMTRGKLSVQLGRPHDSALLRRLIWVEDTNGKKIDGEVSLAKTESIWEFVPKSDWASGNFQIVIASHLEDICGNRVGEPFEVELFKPIGKAAVEAKTVKRGFAIP